MVLSDLVPIFLLADDSRTRNAGWLSCKVLRKYLTSPESISRVPTGRSSIIQSALKNVAVTTGLRFPSMTRRYFRGRLPGSGFICPGLASVMTSTKVTCSPSSMSRLSPSPRTLIPSLYFRG